MKCTECGKEIEGLPAMKGCKPYCQSCFINVKESKTKCRNIGTWWKEMQKLSYSIKSGR